MKQKSSYIDLFLVVLLCHTSCCSPVEYGDFNFDYLLFDQHWPITECWHWKSLNSSNSCSLPQTQNAFFVHGLWPSQSGTKGPNNCSKQPKFDRKALDPILSRLKQRWANVHGGTDDYSFWSHEWKKHGTCAQVLEPFNSELKYFKGSLDLNALYDVYGALAEYGIKPATQSYAVDDVLNAVMKKFGKAPQIYCLISKGQVLLHSVRLCFDRNIKLIDCSSVGVSAKNCGGKKTLQYLNKITVD